MSKSRLSRFKKIVLCFSVVVSLCFTNFALFSLRASANGIDSSVSNVYTFGAPISVTYSSNPNFGNSELFFSGSISSANVFSSNGFSSYWYGSIRSDDEISDLYRFYYYPLSTSQSFEFAFTDNRRAILEFSLDSPVVFSSYTDLINFYGFNFGLQNIRGLLGESVNSCYVTYTYIFADYDNSTDTITIRPVTQERFVDLPNSSRQFSFFERVVLTDALLSSTDTFYNPLDGSDYYVLLDAFIEFSGICAGGFYVDRSFASEVTSYSSYQSFNSSRLLGVLDSDVINDNLNFTDVSWTSWLVNAIGGFMDFQIVPGLSFAGMLGLLIGMSLFIVFLKVFAGG